MKIIWSTGRHQEFISPEKGGAIAIRQNPFIFSKFSDVFSSTDQRNLRHGATQTYPSQKVGIKKKTNDNNVRPWFPPRERSLSIERAQKHSMKNKKMAEHEHGGVQEGGQQQELEMLKAAAQARCGHSRSSQATSEFDARRLNFKSHPSRFRIEAMSRNKSSLLSKGNRSSRSSASGYWDFGQSLWDSYEILAVSKKLESGMVLDDPFSGDPPGRVARLRRERKNSLRNLFNLVSSRRFNEPNVPGDNDSQL